MQLIAAPRRSPQLTLCSFSPTTNAAHVQAHRRPSISHSQFSTTMGSDAEGTKSKTPKDKKKSKKKKDPQPEPEPVHFNAKVEVVREHPEKTPPVIGYFPSGFDPLGPSPDQSGPGPGPTGFQVYRNRNMNKRMQLVVSPAGSHVEFVGTSYAGEAAAGHRSNYALGVFHKESGTLKIVPIAANKIFRLDPKVKGLEAADKEPATSTVEEMTPQVKAVKQRIITDLWGTKKEIEKANKKLALNQDDNAESQRNLNVKMKNVVVNKSALESTESHVSRNIPPYDLSATTPEEAFVLDQIILKGEWDYLEDIYNILQRGEAADFSAYPTFVHNRIEKLKKIKDESEKKKLSCILSFINHLIKFKDLHSLDHSSAKDHRIPNILRHRFSAMFAVSESRRLPPEKIDLLICYVLVMTLFADEFRTNYSDIAKDLRMGEVPLRQLFLQLGCKISLGKKTQEDARYATLPVPLKFPDLRQRKRKR